MLILAVDTSAAPCCAAVYDTEKQLVAAETVINNKLTHSVTLMPVIRDLLKNADIKPDDIDLFAVSVGPGSFTGLRIGISAVKGMAYAAKKPCAAVTTSEGMAYNFIGEDAVICTAIDARCNQVYNALFKASAENVTRLCDERCIKTDELAKELLGIDGEIIITGDAAQSVFDEAQSLGIKDVRLAPPAERYQTGHGVCLAAQSAKAISPECLMPLYLKLPQAQRELMEKQKNAENKAKE